MQLNSNPLDAKHSCSTPKTCEDKEKVLILIHYNNYKITQVKIKKYKTCIV